MSCRPRGSVGGRKLNHRGGGSAIVKMPQRWMHDDETEYCLQVRRIISLRSRQGGPRASSHIKSNDRADILKLHVVAAHGPCVSLCLLLQCHAEFNPIRRKHHCRSCGRIYCDVGTPHSGARSLLVCLLVAADSW